MTNIDEIKALVSLATSAEEANVELFKLYPLQHKLAALKHWWNVEIHQSQTQSGLRGQPYFFTTLHFAGCWVRFWAERCVFFEDSSVWLEFKCDCNEERYEDNFWIEEDVKYIKNSLVELRSFIRRNI